MTKDYSQKYIEFASNIQFYEFLQDEYKKPHFKVNEYLTEIKDLSKKNNWDIESLSKFLHEHPKSFEIFEEIFQLSRFTNTQLTYFLFKVGSLNTTDRTTYINELKKIKSEFPHLTKAEIIKSIEESITKDSFDYYILILKLTVFKYLSDCIKDCKLIHTRLSNPDFKDVPKRISEYLVNNLSLNETLKGINVTEFLTNKRRAIDTKSIHGKFGTIKITEILKKHAIINADDIFNKLGIKEIKSEVNHPQLEPYKNKFISVTERYIDGISKSKDKKPKKFDFVILYDLKPKILIETNYYTTSGTKIGINQGEYVDLKQDIEKSFDYLFIWITDGNYWLTSDGHSRLLNLYTYFGDQILNYNLFDKKLPELMNKIQ